MIRNIFAAAAIAALGACATPAGGAAADPVFPAAGPVSDAALNDDAAYTAAFREEVLAARAMVEAGEFAVICNASGQQYEYRVGARTAVVDAECGGRSDLPTLQRRKVISDDSSLLLVVESNMGIGGEGVILREDRDAAVPLSLVDIDNMWVFGPVLSENRLVLVTGALSAAGCGITRHDKELTLNWDRGQIIAEREIPSPPLTCADQAAN